MNIRLTITAMLSAALTLFSATATRAADASIPTFPEIGKAYLITLPATVNQESAKIVEIVSAAGGGWYRVISYSIGANGAKLQVVPPTEMWINFTQVVTATEARTNEPAK